MPLTEVERLRQALPRDEVRHASTEPALNRFIVDADVLFGWRLQAEQFAKARALRWIQTPNVGLGGLLFAELRRGDVVVTNSRGVNAVPTAEHVLGLMLTLARGLHRAARAREWTQDALDGDARLLKGMTVGLVGLGTAGAEIAARCAAFGMKVIALRRRPGLAHGAAVSEVRGPDSLEWLLRSSDAVVLAAPSTEKTRGMISARQLERTKPGAMLINVARGDLIDLDALTSALEQGKLSAALDVFPEEPLDGKSPLWAMPNVIITPHIAASRPDYWRIVTDMFVENVERFRRGEPLHNIIDKAEGY